MLLPMASDLNAGRVRCFDQKHLTLYDIAYNAVWQKVVCYRLHVIMLGFW